MVLRQGHLSKSIRILSLDVRQFPRHEEDEHRFRSALPQRIWILHHLAVLSVLDAEQVSIGSFVPSKYIVTRCCRALWSLCHHFLHVPCIYISAVVYFQKSRKTERNEASGSPLKVDVAVAFCLALAFCLCTLSFFFIIIICFDAFSSV